MYITQKRIILAYIYKLHPKNLKTIEFIYLFAYVSLRIIRKMSGRSKSVNIQWETEWIKQVNSPCNYTGHSISCNLIKCKENQFAPAFMQQAKHRGPPFCNHSSSFLIIHPGRIITSNKDLRVFNPSPLLLWLLHKAQDHTPKLTKICAVRCVLRLAVVMTEHLMVLNLIQFHYGLVTLLSFAHTVDTAWV